MSLYETLGISENASDDEISQAFKQRAMHLHPDRAGGDPTAFKAIEKAHRVLKDPNSRKHYDETGEDKKPKKQEGESILAGLFSQMIDQNVKEGDLIQQAKDAVEQKLIQIAQKEIEVNTDKKKFEQMLNRVGVTENPNLYENIIEQRIQGCEHGLELLLESKTAVQEAMKLLENYKDTAPQIIIPTVATYTYTTASTLGF